MEGKSWEEVECLGNIYSARTGHTVACDSKYIYLFGGTDGQSRNNDLYKFDPISKTWSLLEATGTVPQSRSGSQCVLYMNLIYFFGGYTKKDGEYFNDLSTFDINHLRWSEALINGPEVPCKRTDHTLSLYKDCLYVFGGYDGRSRFNDLYRFETTLRTWTFIQQEIAPQNRFGHSAIVQQDKLIIFGGWNGHITLNDIWAYSFSTEKWNEILPTTVISARYRHIAVPLGNSMFIFGGVNKEQVRFNDTYEFNIKYQYWVKVETHKDPSPRTFHRSVVLDGFLYVLGGYDGSRKNDMFRLDLHDLSPEDEIESNPLLPTNSLEDGELCWKEIECVGKNYSARTGHCAININGIIHVFGGTDETTRRNDLHCFDIGASTWRLIECAGDVPTARSGAKCVEWSNYIYIFGGYTRKDGIYYDDVHRFHIQTCIWSKIITEGQPPMPRTDHTAVIHESCMYIFAGYDGKNRYNDLQSLDLETNTWKPMPSEGSVPPSRFGHTCIVYNQSMYVFGGWDGHDTLDDLYQYSFGSKIWYELRKTQGIKPNPRYRHSCVLHESSLFIFGGVDKSQIRYNDLYEYNIDKREWVCKRTTGKCPSSRTFHRSVMHGEFMFVLGGFDGKRKNDLYSIKLRCDTVLDSSRPTSALSRIFDVEDNVETNNFKDLHEQNILIKETIKELSKQLEIEEEKGLCKICYEKDIDTVLLECAHRLTCSKCAQNLKQCPVDRKPITRIIKTLSNY
jgi:N-acetylneuraminic acid mutarotase